MIEKVYGINATCMTMDERFTQLSAISLVGPHQRRPSNAGNFQNKSAGYWSPNWLEEISRQLEQAQKQYQASLGVGHRGRFVSEAPGLRRSNSLGNMSQRSFGKASWRQSNGDLSSNRSVSIGNARSVNGRRMRGFKRRGGGQRAIRGRFRNGRQNQNRRGGAGIGRGGVRRMRGRGRPRGRGNVTGSFTRNQTPKPVPSKEELDAQLEQYMAGTKAALDKQLEDYMKNAMEIEM